MKNTKYDTKMYHQTEYDTFLCLPLTNLNKYHTEAFIL